MNWFVDNWYIVVSVVAICVMSIITVSEFIGMPSKNQIAKVKEWLLYAVTMAEAEFGGGTGKLKLRSVYDMFIAKFPVMAKVISFETFSLWVDDALDEMRKMLETNENVKQLVNANIT